MRICSSCNRENDGVKGKYCIYCGAKLVKKKHYNKNEYIGVNNKDKKSKRRMKRAIIILSIVIAIETIAMIVFGLFQFFTYRDEIDVLESELSVLRYSSNYRKERVKELENDNGNMREKCGFFDKNIVFVIEGYGNYYYTYDQMEQVTQGKSYSYWAYNVEQAKGLGYRAWK